MSRTLNIKGMSCEHCVSSVEGALNGLDGVKDVQVDLKAGQVTFNYNENLAIKNRLLQRLKTLGMML